MSKETGSHSLKPKYLVLVVDDEESFLRSMEQGLPRRVEGRHPEFDCEFEFCSTVEGVFSFLEEIRTSGETLALVISDQKMPVMTGVELIEKVRAQYPDTSCMLLTGYAGLESARYAINRHLLDQYVSKPIRDLESFAATVENLVASFHFRRLKEEKAAEVVRHLEELEIANEMIRRMKESAEQMARFTRGLRTLDVDEVLDVGVKMIPPVVGASGACFLLPDPKGDLVVVRRVGEEQCCGRSAEQILEGEAAVTPGNAQAERRVTFKFELPSMSRNGNMLKEGRSEGGVCLHLAEECRSEEEMAYAVSLVRDVFGASVANAMAFTAAREASREDALTGVYRRHVFEEALHVAHYAACRYRRPLSVAIVDIDFFKSVNDRLGHCVGDAVLRGVAGVISRLVRKSDLVARYGGDEFVILLPETSAAMGIVTLKRIREGVGAARLGIEGLHVTVSAGVAGVRPGDSVGVLLQRADEALYSAKRSGRDRVCPDALPEETVAAPTEVPGQGTCRSS